MCKYFKKGPNCKKYSACDHFTGDSDGLSNAPNGGFAYVHSNLETIEFYRF